MILDLATRAHVVNPRLTAYVYIDNRAAAGFAQALIPVVEFLADRKLGERLRVTAEIAEWAIDRSGGSHSSRWRDATTFSLCSPLAQRG